MSSLWKWSKNQKKWNFDLLKRRLITIKPSHLDNLNRWNRGWTHQYKRREYFNTYPDTPTDTEGVFCILDSVFFCFQIFLINGFHLSVYHSTACVVRSYFWLTLISRTRTFWCKGWDVCLPALYLRHSASRMESIRAARGGTLTEQECIRPDETIIIIGWWSRIVFLSSIAVEISLAIYHILIFNVIPSL